MLKSIHYGRLNVDGDLKPLDLLNKFYELHLEELFPNLCITLRIFCTIPISVAEAERSFSKLNIIKNIHRSTIKQERLNSLATLAIESELSRKIDFHETITLFAKEKARKAFFNK